MQQRELKIELNDAYKSAMKYAKRHYENFPVISLFVKKELRKHVAVIYQFARQADDIADEGSDPPQIRLSKLNEYENDFELIFKEKYADEFWHALRNTIDEKRLSPVLFTDLLAAFKQDVVKNRYFSYDVLLDYCRCSANPVGRLILELHGITDESIMGYSDSICSALQLTNFWQDVSLDIQKDRIYIPESDMEKFGVDEEVIFSKQMNRNFKKLMEFEIKRTRELFNHGRKLINYLPGLLKKQIEWTILGGEAILKKIEEIDYNVLNNRPKLKKIDYIKLMSKSLV